MLQSQFQRIQQFEELTNDQKQQQLKKILITQKIYIIVMGFGNVGKSTFISSLLCNLIPQNKGQISIIKYHDLQQMNEYEEYDEEYDENIRICQMKSKFQEDIVKEYEYRRKIRIIDTPSVNGLQQLDQLLKRIKKYIKDHPYKILWVSDYTMTGNLEFNENLLIQQMLVRQSATIILNKIDQRSFGDNPLSDIIDLYNTKSVYKISSLWAQRYRISNYGIEQDKEMIFEQWKINFNREQCLNNQKRLFNQMITNNEQLIQSQDYTKLLQNLEKEIKSELFNIKNTQLYQQCSMIQFQGQFQISQKQIHTIYQLFQINLNNFQEQLQNHKLDIEYNLNIPENQQKKQLNQFFCQFQQQIDNIFQNMKIELTQFENQIIKDIQAFIPSQAQNNELDDVEIIDPFQQSFISFIKQECFQELYSLMIQQQQIVLNNLENGIQLLNKKNHQFLSGSLITSSIFGCKTVCSSLFIVEIGIAAAVCTLIIGLVQLFKNKNQAEIQRIQDNFDNFLLEQQGIIEQMNKSCCQGAENAVAKIHHLLKISAIN